METPTRFPLGAATISLLNMGLLKVRLAEWLSLDEADWPSAYMQYLEAPILVPVQCVHIALPGRSILVDACHPELLAQAGEELGEGPPAPGLLAQLAAVGVEPEQVDSVVITHPHFDHYCGIVAAGAAPADERLTFPRARHLLGQADWEAMQEALRSPASPVSRAFGLAERLGMLELVAGARDLGDGVSIVPAPGETPGHQAVRVSSEGQSLYILGDLYHHSVEVEQQDWGVHWADAEATAQSRRSLVKAALDERALLIATHIGGLGRLRRTSSGLSWAEV